MHCIYTIRRITLFTRTIYDSTVVNTKQCRLSSYVKKIVSIVFFHLFQQLSGNLTEPINTGRLSGSKSHATNRKMIGMLGKGKTISAQI